VPRVSPTDPRTEALFYLRWVRGAAGRFDWADEARGGVTALPPSASSAVPVGSAASGSVGGDPGLPGPGLALTEPSAASRRTPGDSSHGPGGARVSGDAGVTSSVRPRSVGVAGEGPTAIRTGPDDALDPWVPLNREDPGGREDPGDPLDAIASAAAVCRRCRLCETRTNVVFGEGPRRPRLVVIGEAPGADEDASGHPFVGAAGQLLTKMLAAIGLAREDVYITNVLKCRPPGNRPPAPDETAACRPYLEEQIRLLDPELLLLLGPAATQAVLGTDRGVRALRGQLTTMADGRATLPTYHPADLLRTPESKREAWLDLQRVALTLGLSVPPRSA